MSPCAVARSCLRWFPAVFGLALLAAGCGGAACPSTQMLCSGACSDLTRDPLHCGGCGVACGGGKQCVDSKCANSCPVDQTDCGGSCRDLQGDVANCGACGKACAGGQVCSKGACSVSCAANLTNCAGSCRDLMADGMNCGACGSACSVGQVCAMGKCAVSCPGGLTPCNSSCRDLQGDAGNCGVCGKACNPGESCAKGACTLSCQPGLTDCGGKCRDTMTDGANCGGCGAACKPGEACVAGACAASCMARLNNCGGTCRDLQTDAANCGACDKVCVGNEKCVMGACKLSCPMGQSPCSSVCRDLQTDIGNCGACGTVCANPQVCVAGKCAVPCLAPALMCGNACVDPRNDPANCGGCGKACGAPANGAALCVNSACEVLCKIGFANCDGMAANGCEVDVRTTVSHCGGCGVVCASPANGAAGCVSGACKAVCAPNFNDCDGLYGNGCESDLRTDASNCGSCGKVCAGNTPACSASICVAPIPVSCRAAKMANPNAASGVFQIDSDGAGPAPAFSTYCDMTTDGGGWTLLVNRITNSDNLGQPDLNTTVGVFDNSRATNFTINVVPFYAAAAEFVYAVRHSNACAGCTVAMYDSAVRVPRSLSNQLSMTCPATEAVNVVKMVGPGNGTVLLAYRCTGSLGWGNCTNNICHWGIHNVNVDQDGNWANNAQQEMHFPSAHSTYRSFVNNGSYCRSCGGGLGLNIFNPNSSACCNSPGNPDRSTWTVWVR